jgi:exosortase
MNLKNSHPTKSENHLSRPISPIKWARDKNTSLKFIILLILWGIAFLPVYPDLVSTWMNNSNNSHGILVPLISIYLVWQKRDKLKSAHVSHSIWGAVILLASFLIYIISYAGAVAVVSRAMIISSLIGLVLFSFGSTIFSILKFPLFYLIFMVPVPDSIYMSVAFPLQLFATKVSAGLIQILSIPVHREGNMLYFAHAQLEVAEACSGLRSMVSYVMLGVLFSYFMGNKKWGGKIAIILSAIPIAIIGNIMRVTGTGILAHFFGPQVARGWLHEFSGLAVFIFGFILFILEYIFLMKILAKREFGQ